VPGVAALRLHRARPTWKRLPEARMVKRARKPARLTRRRRAGENHAVVSIATYTEVHAFRREPCEQCPWRKDQVGAFPTEAFRISAPTSYDAATTAFGCHMSKHAAPLTCAGFLLSEGAVHNLMLRMAQAYKGLDIDKVSPNGIDLFPNYRSMAIANGVDPRDPVLKPCRDDSGAYRFPPRRRKRT
jgi:hypothetical protein